MGLRTATAAWEEPLLRSLLDNHNPGEGFFCALIESAGHRVFEVAYDRGQRESVSVGAIDPTRSRYNGQIWTQFRARHDPPCTEPKPRIRNYAIDLTVGSDSRLSA